MSIDHAPARGVIEIFSPAVCREAEEIKLSVDLSYMGQRKELWYRFPAEYESCISTTSDPFVIAVLFLAMEKGLDIQVHGEVTQSLIDNLEYFQQVWKTWEPAKYTKISIFPDAIAEPEQPKKDHVAMLFSGGLDSCYTAWKHAVSKDSAFPGKPRSALFVLGFDIPVEESQFFDSYYAKAKVLTDSIGIDLIPLQFNFRKIIVDWEMSHCTGLASCLHLFSGLFSIGLIASSHAYDSLRFPWGSNPLTDPLLSSDRLRIINDGGECRRWEKAAVVADWEEAMKHLRVCYEGKERDRNCGVCSNCLLTAIGFAAAGKTPPAALNVRTIKGAVWQLFALPLKPMGVVRINQMITFAEEHNTTAPWLTLLRACSRFHKMRLRLLPPLRKIRRLSKALKKKLCGAVPVKLSIP